MNSDISPTNQTNSQPTVPVSAAIKKPFYKRSWVIGLGIFLVLGIVVFPLAAWVGRSGDDNSGSSVNAENLFYRMIETAGQKNSVRLNLYQESYKDTSADAKTLPEQKMLRITDYDYQKQEFSTIYASKYGQFSARGGKCIKGQEYKPDQQLLRRDTFEDAVAAVNKSTPVTAAEAIEYMTCNLKQVYSPKMGDGVLPIGVTDQQVQAMIADLKRRQAVLIKDEGKAMHDGRKLRKISIAVGETAGKKEYESNRFFFSLRDGVTGKIGGNVSVDDLSKHFDNTFILQSPSGGLTGFYLVDEQTNLPVYSELSTTANGHANFKPLFRKHRYQYNASLTVSDGTKLEKF